MTEGSLLECIVPSDRAWGWDADHVDPNFGPKYGDIVTCDGTVVAKGRKYVSLLEYPELDPKSGERFWFDSAGFREIQPPMSIPESLFNEQTQVITI